MRIDNTHTQSIVTAFNAGKTIERWTGEKWVAVKRLYIEWMAAYRIANN